MNSIVLVLLIGSLALFIFGLFLLGFFLFHSRKMRINKEKIQTLELDKAKKSLIDSIEIQETERARIGADIHDDLGPTMSAIKLKINSLSASKAPSTRDITQLNEMVNETIENLRGLSHSLYPSTLQNYGFANSIMDLSNMMSSDKMKVTCTVDEEIDSLEFYTQINLYRIIQEFCNNALKYSKCTAININITKQHNHVIVSLKDNGVGFDLKMKKATNGIGMRNMKMRATAINYSFDLKSEIDKGTELILTSDEDPANISKLKKIEVVS